MEDILQLRLNPIVPLLRGLFALLCTALSILLLAASGLIVYDKGFRPLLLLYIPGNVLFAWLGYALLRRLNSQTRRYIIDKNGITQLNYLSGIEKSISKSSIIHVRKEAMYLNPLRLQQIVIYLDNGRKLIFRPYEFFNFSKIIPLMTTLGYPVGN